MRNERRPASPPRFGYQNYSAYFSDFSVVFLGVSPVEIGDGVDALFGGFVERRAG